MNQITYYAKTILYDDVNFHSAHAKNKQFELVNIYRLVFVFRDRKPIILVP